MPTANHKTQSSARIVILGEPEKVSALADAISGSLRCEVHAESDHDGLMEGLRSAPADVLLLDTARLPVPPADFVRRMRSFSPGSGILLITAPERVEEAVAGLKQGAFDYLTTPYNADEAIIHLERLLAHMSLLDENRLLKERVRLHNGYGGLLGASAAMQKLFRAIQKVTRGTYPVLIMGENGTGKELVARTIHDTGLRREQPFVPVDCGAIVPTLFESELFGHVRGAFTGASREKQGLLVSAGEGIVFLDEVGELPPELQAKLLRCLQEREVRPVGSNHAVRFDARVLAATNRDLQEAVDQGKFRADLFYRLNVVTLRVPPLRAHKSDIPQLVRHLLRRYAEEDGARKELSQEALEALIEYDWPGNVRELENAVRGLTAMNTGPVIQLTDLPTHLRREAPRTPDGAMHPVLPLRELERDAIFRAITACGGDKLKAARMLGIGKTTLYRKLKEYEQHGSGARS